MSEKVFSKLIGRIKTAFLPGEGNDGRPPIDVGKDGEVAPRQRMLNALKEHFISEMRNETTTESLLFHTSFTVYIRAEEYDKLSPSFAQTVRDAVNIFIREVRSAVEDYPDYQNHSRFWEMQLVAIPESAEIDGIGAELLNENPIIIKSKLFAENEYDPRIKDEVQCVTTIHTKDSSKEVPNAFNLAALKGLTELAKDKYRVEFSLSDTVKAVPKSEADRPGAGMSVYATLHIVDGDFILGERIYHLYNMTGSKLLVSGKNGSASTSAAVDEIHINDESVLNPTLEITRDQTRHFSLKAWGDVKLGGRRVAPGIEVPLPHNSSIMINGDYQIDFKTK